MNTYTFFKKNGCWYMGSQVNFHSKSAIIEGCGYLLDHLARNQNEVTLTFDIKPFEHASLLEISSRCRSPIGGGYYILYNRMGRLIKSSIWLCNLPLLLFRSLPERIFLRVHHVLPIFSQKRTSGLEQFF
jgi:hypothetical protein